MRLKAQNISSSISNNNNINNNYQSRKFNQTLPGGRVNPNLSKCVNSNSNNNVMKKAGITSSTIPLSSTTTSTSINLSRLSTSKGKFSLSNRYNSNGNGSINNKFNQNNNSKYGSLYSHNQQHNNDYQSYQQQNNHLKNTNNYNELQTTHIDKENIQLLSNQLYQSRNNNKKGLFTKINNKLFQNYQHHHHLNHLNKNNNNNNITQQSQIHQIRNIANNTHSLKQKQTIINSNNNNRRRSIIHKYDNINNQFNQFLFMQQGNGQIISINEKTKQLQNIQKKKNNIKKQNNNDNNAIVKVTQKQQVENRNRNKSKQKVKILNNKLRDDNCNINQKQSILTKTAKDDYQITTNNHDEKMMLLTKYKQQQQQHQQIIDIYKHQLTQNHQQIQQLNQQLYSKQQQLNCYKKSMKEISYSMIKMISIMNKWQQCVGGGYNNNNRMNQNNNNNNNNNNKDNKSQQQQFHSKIIMKQLKKQISLLYNKQLTKYIDQLNIREQLIELAQRESLIKERLQNQMNKDYSNGNNHFDVSLQNDNQSECTFVEQDGDDSIVVTNCNNEQYNEQYNQQPQQQSMHTQTQSIDSLHMYQLKSTYNYCHNQNNQISTLESYCDNNYNNNNNQYNNYNNNNNKLEYTNVNTQHQHQQQQQSKHHHHYPQQQQFGIDRLRYEMMDLRQIASGRNLLQTFNQQHLCQQLQNINNHQHQQYQQQQQYQYQYQQQQQSNTTTKYYNDDNLSLSNNKQLLAHNLQLALKNTHYIQHTIAQNQQQFNNVCRKLFDDDNNCTQSQIKQQIQQSQQKTKTISNNQLSNNSKHLISNKQQLQLQPHLQPEHHYKLTNSILYNQQQQQLTTNYLKIQPNSIFKLLRKVDSNRWIAQCNDKIGFLLQSAIVNNVVLVKQQELVVGSNDTAMKSIVKSKEQQ